MIALQPEYWPEAKRAFQPIDIEYLSCECRKYYSYVNGTKAFEGKNVFHPGQSPRLLWDIPTPAEPFTPIQTRIQVIAGAPCSGKTTLLRALAAQGHRVERETAELLLEEAVARGERADERRADPVAWQQELLQRDFELFDGLPTDELIYADTSIIGTLAYSHRAGLVEGANLAAWLRAKRYQRVFFLEPVGDYKKSAVRRESSNLASQLSENVKACYRRYGYEVISVPGGSVEERLKIIQRYAGVAH